MAESGAAWVESGDLARVEDDMSATLAKCKKAYDDVKGTIDGLNRSIEGELTEKIKETFYSHDDDFQRVFSSMRDGEDLMATKGNELHKVTAKIEDGFMRQA